SSGQEDASVHEIPLPITAAENEGASNQGRRVSSDLKKARYGI
ncbi:hypothetical protein L915_17753, partial [Phytophthora nicotianae]